MKKISFLSLILSLILMLSAPVFAQVTINGPGTSGPFSPITGANLQQGQSLNSTISPNITVSPTNNNMIGNGIGNFSPSAYAGVDNDIRNSNTNFNSDTNIVGQSQLGIVAPVQDVKVIFKSPTQLLGINVPPMSDINFGNGQFTDITKDWPMFNVGIAKFDPGKDVIKKVVDTTKNEKYVDSYSQYISDATAALKKYKALGKESKLRVQIFKAEAQKTIQGGVNLSGVGSALSPAGTTGGGGGGVTGIQVGNTKSNPLISYIIVEIV